MAALARARIAAVLPLHGGDARREPAGDKP
jgi:hypothetical protein